MSEEKKAAVSAAEIEELQQALVESQAKAEEYLLGWQRAKADYANLIKENDSRAKEMMEWANTAFMSEIIPVYSHFKTALKHIPEDQQKEGWVQGVMFIGKQFADFLNKYGIKEISTVGEKFDHNIHEAVTHEEKDGFTEDVIFEEVQPGYMLNDKLLSPAKVKVAK